MALPERRLYPKLPPLRSKDIEWDADGSDKHPPLTRTVGRSQTMPSKSQKASGVYLAMDGDAVRRKV